MFDKKEDGVVANPVDIEETINDLMEYFGYELDFYCEANPCDNSEDPYSFRTTVVMPCWPGGVFAISLSGTSWRKQFKQNFLHIYIHG